MERLIMEAYKLLQNGDMEQAESLLLEGASITFLLVGCRMCPADALSPERNKPFEQSVTDLIKMSVGSCKLSVIL